jgi:hypothetical protein
MNISTSCPMMASCNWNGKENNPKIWEMAYLNQSMSGHIPFQTSARSAPNNKTKGNKCTAPC